MIAGSMPIRNDRLPMGTKAGSVVERRIPIEADRALRKFAGVNLHAKIMCIEAPDQQARF